MKKLILTFVTLFSFTHSYYGQKVSMGPEIGMNTIPVENTEIGQNYQLGHHFGGHLKFHFSEKFKLSTGVFISQKKKGYSSSYTSPLVDDLLGGFGGFVGPDTSGLDSLLNIPGLNTDITETTKGITSEIFIEIPILANYKLKNVNFYLGPYIGILLSATKNEEVTTEIPALDVLDLDALGFGGFASFLLPESGTETTSISGTDGLRSLDFGVNAGIGYEMNDLHFNFMYSYGLLDYRDDNEGEDKETLKLFRVSIAYLFDLTKKDKESSARFN
ncbi:MAG: outer membrane beta-barrel protein [Flavobacteriales bacterium]|nr:outer membrane beta-barrel protein [Flavobacteriales bacterium]